MIYDHLSSIALYIGRPDSDFLCVNVVRRTEPTSHDFFDGNWLEADAELKSATFSGVCKVTLRAEAFVQFRDQLSMVIEKGKGVARFAPMEPWLTIGLQRDCYETAELLCSLRDNLEASNELRARFRVDSSLLPGIVEQLDRLIEAYPVVGRG